MVRDSTSFFNQNLKEEIQNLGEKNKLITYLIKEKLSFVSTRLGPLCLWICTISLFGFSYLVFADGICDRTNSIQDAIVDAIEDVSHCNDVTPANLEEVLSLDLSNLSLTSLDKDDFEGLVRLKTLDLSDNNLEELPAGLFNHAHLPLLNTLYLHNNNLNSYDTLEEAVFLETLTIYGNPSVSEQLFDDLHRFYGLTPTATEIAQSVQGVSLLEKFLRDNEIVTVEDFISALPPLYKEHFVRVTQEAMYLEMHILVREAAKFGWTMWDVRVMKANLQTVILEESRLSIFILY